MGNWKAVWRELCRGNADALGSTTRFLGTDPRGSAGPHEWRLRLSPTRSISPVLPETENNLNVQQNASQNMKVQYDVGMLHSCQKEEGSIDLTLSPKYAKGKKSKVKSCVCHILPNMWKQGAGVPLCLFEGLARDLLKYGVWRGKLRAWRDMSGNTLLFTLDQELADFFFFGKGPDK